jgi:hypothetical protein
MYCWHRCRNDTVGCYTKPAIAMNNTICMAMRNRKRSAKKDKRYAQHPEEKSPGGAHVSGCF